LRGNRIGTFPPPNYQSIPIVTGERVSRVRVAILTGFELLAEGLECILAAEDWLVIRRAIDTSSAMISLPADDVVLIDSNLRDALCRCATAVHSDGPPVILIGAPEDDRWACEALRAGARGMVAASASRETLIRAIRTVHQGAMWIPRHLLIASIDHILPVSGQGPQQNQVLARLSTREREVFRFAATGLSNKDLAHQLHIAVATVKVHLTSIFAKLGIHGRAELAAAYHGILPTANLEAGLRHPA
jgi:DNA-binding NarL/FixJ family response regulator